MPQKKLSTGAFASIRRLPVQLGFAYQQVLCRRAGRRPQQRPAELAYDLLLRMAVPMEIDAGPTERCIRRACKMSAGEKSEASGGRHALACC